LESPIVLLHSENFHLRFKTRKTISLSITNYGNFFRPMADDGDARFLTTQWTRILGPESADSKNGSQALILLCETYHYPVYAFIRNRCGDAEKARDLSQGFFEFLIEKKLYRSADRERGRFRTFLLAAVKNYLAKDYRDATTLKRGGNERSVSIDLLEVENHYQADLSSDVAPDAFFDHKWAVTVFDQVWTALEDEYHQLEQKERFEALRPCLTDPADAPSYAELAIQLDTSEGAIKAAVFRLKSRFRNIFRQAVSQIVDNPSEVDEEIRYLIEASSIKENA